MVTVDGLEIIDKGATSPAHGVPLLFVHGAWHAAWCWDEYFLDFFAERGYRAVAVSLRGHGGSRPHPRPRACAMEHLVADVAAVADELGTEPVVVGHSLGGAVVQKYLETHRAPAGVLIASMPVTGIRGYTARMWRRHPLRAARVLLSGKSLHSVACSPERTRQCFYSPSMSAEEIERYAELLCEELNGRVTFDNLGLNRPRPERVTTPLLVLAGELDQCFTVAEAHTTARAYGAEAHVFPGMGHNMMLEPDWPAVAQRIDQWLGERGL
jgi:pimeloyl-ACP methyl ester carboxylesterase